MKKIKVIFVILSFSLVIGGCTSDSNFCGSGTIGSEKCRNNLECQYNKGCLDSNGSVYVDMDGYRSGVCVKKAEYPACK